MQKKRRIVIVGGGSAGWMTATFLSKVLDLENDSSQYSITLVESDQVAPIGVGEATVHTLRQFLGACGVQEGEFMLAADATFKHGILFRDWYKAPADESDQYFHPFEGYPPLAPELMVNHWLNARHHGVSSDRYDKWAGVQGVLAANYVAPKDWQAKPYEGVVPYGYHIDAGKFADYLKSVSLRRGVVHLVGHIENIELGENGYVTQLILRGQKPLDGDFFIDCSGFNSLIIKKLGAKFSSMSAQLPVDRAVTTRLARTSESWIPRPFTTATAREAGWTFEIDLRGRSGIGYIYSSSHITADEAEGNLRRIVEIDSEHPVNHIKTRVGRLEDVWIKNCLAIGLSAGFLEPLESTGIYLIELALRLFVDYIDLDFWDERLIRRYNRAVAQIFDDIANFILMHYIISRRDDSDFWRDIQLKNSKDIEGKLALWSQKAPTDGDFDRPANPFGASNYAAILFGMQRLTKVVPGSVRHIPPSQSLSHYKALKDLQQNLVAKLPRHEQYLQKYTAAFS